MGRVSKEMIQRIRELYAKHLNEQRVAKELGLDRRTVHKYAHTSEGTNVDSAERISTHKDDNDNNFGVDTEKVESSLELSRDDNKILYADLIAGRPPAEIVARHGFPPEMVEREQRRITRMKNFPLVKLQEYMLSYFKAYYTPGMGEYVKTFNEKGSLTIEETISLIDIGTLNYAFRMGARENWYKLACVNCQEVIAFVDPTDVIGMGIIRQYSNF